MPLNFTAAPSSRINRSYRASKPGSLPKSLRRTSSAPSTTKAARTNHRLEETDGYIPPRALLLSSSPSHPTGALAGIEWIRTNTFTPMPENFKGFHTDKIAEILNFRDRIPPYVPVNFLTALLNAPTATSREIADLVAKGVIRRFILNRSRDEGGVAPTKDLYAVISNSGLPQELKEKYTQILKDNPTVSSLPGYFFTDEEIRTLVAAGFLTLPNASRSPYSEDFITSAGSTLTSALTSASGSDAAVGGRGIVTSLGYTQLPTSASAAGSVDYIISLPGLGPFVNLLLDAKAHLLNMLKKQAGKGGCTEKHLRERWDSQGVIIGKTKKWKEFKGVSWKATVGAALGSGEIEVFGTTVGYGLRLRR